MLRSALPSLAPRFVPELKNGPLNRRGDPHEIITCVCEPRGSFAKGNSESAAIASGGADLVRHQAGCLRHRDSISKSVDVGSGNRVVTVIEFVSPTNKLSRQRPEALPARAQKSIDAEVLVEIRSMNTLRLTDRSLGPRSNCFPRASRIPSQGMAARARGKRHRHLIR